MELWTQLQTTIAGALPGLSERDVRIPARRAACDCYLPDATELPLTAERFGTLFGVPLVASVTVRNGRAYFELTDAFYSACVALTNSALPLPACDYGDYALNRMLSLARQGGVGCPEVPSVQRALLLCTGAPRSRSLVDQAGQAFLAMLRAITPQRRQALRADCGAVAAACARLYAQRFASASTVQPTR